MVMICEVAPACSVPVLQDEDMAAPDCVCAEAANGEPAGNVPLPGIAVAVCANESLLTKRIALPTATVVIAGA